MLVTQRHAPTRAGGRIAHTVTADYGPLGRVTLTLVGPDNVPVDHVLAIFEDGETITVDQPHRYGPVFDTDWILTYCQAATSGLDR